MSHRAVWLFALLMFVGCFGKSETQTIQIEDGGDAQTTAAPIDIPADNPAIKWSQMEFDQLPKVVISDAPETLKPFAGQEDPEGTPVPEEVQQLLAAYKVKDLDKLTELALTFPQKKIRERALEKVYYLLSERPTEVANVLQAGLLDSDPDVSFEVLARYSNNAEYWDKEAFKSSVPTLAAMLGPGQKHPDVAGRILGEFGPVAAPALPQLCWAAAHDNSDALKAIGAIGPGAKETIPLLQKLTWEEDSFAGAEALGQLQASDLVLKLLQSQDERKLWMGIIGANHLEKLSPEMITILLGTVVRDHTSISAESAKALGKVRPSTPEIAAAILQAPRHDVAWADAAICRTVAQLDPPAPGALDFLNRRLGMATSDSERESVQEAITEWKSINKQPIESLLQDVIVAQGDVSDSISDQYEELYEPLIKVAADKEQPNEIRAAALLALDSVQERFDEGRSAKIQEIVKLCRDCLAEKPGQPLLGAAAHVSYSHGATEEAERAMIEGVATPGFLKPRQDNIRAIGYLKIEAGLPTLIDLINKQEMAVMEDLLEEIGDFGETAADAVPGIVKLPIDPSDEKQTELFKNQLKALGEIGAHPEISIPFFKQRMEKTDERLWERGEVLEAWAEVVGKNDEDPTEVLQMADAMLKQMLVNHMRVLLALKELGPKAAPMVDTIISYLDDKTVNWYACEAIEAIGPAAKAAEPKLIQAANEWEYKGRPILALAAIGASSPEFGQLVEERLADVNSRTAMLEGLSKMGPAAAPYVAAIAKTLDSKNEYEREKAIKTLGAIGPAAKSEVDRLKKMAEEDESYSVKYAAKGAVADIEGRAEPKEAEDEE
ncbi:hypothetical protein LOC68_21315 [Blastopirellula sp. JC732]|uniref:HEAT repeat domain-containing protein n=1 Tax=Blastopirellula sediminis TaxID=2894196 RepID=A0A9X1MPG2_9BACT|nr:hypothetical protein [Blastopirellula sediminis]MCC9605762.1 hypothetical protein [Blastopirellula sediminis]MCC9630938.1 hypothetical protein [Blastopirellula sediminis]